MSKYTIVIRDPRHRSTFDAPSKLAAARLAKSWIAVQDWPGNPKYILALLELDGAVVAELRVKMATEVDLPFPEDDTTKEEEGA